MSRGNEDGQATLEVALLLPVVVVLAGVLVEVGSLATDNVRLWHAAREAARVGAVDPDTATIQDAADSAGLRPIEVRVDPGPEARIQGEPLTVDVTYRPTTKIPLIGALFEGMVMKARATMRIEQP